MFSIFSSAECCVLRGTEGLYVVYAFDLFLFYDLLHHSHTYTHMHDVPRRHIHLLPYTCTHTSKQGDRQTNTHTDRRTDMLMHPPKTCMRLSACTWVVQLITRCSIAPTPHVPVSMVPNPSLPYPLLSSSHQYSHYSTTASLFVDLQRYVYSILLTHVQYSILAVHQECPYCA